MCFTPAEGGADDHIDILEPWNPAELATDVFAPGEEHARSPGRRVPIV